jgi:serine/threonine protein kinase
MEIRPDYNPFSLPDDYAIVGSIVACHSLGSASVLEKIGKYKIIDKIGTGAMGRYVAIKTMSPQYVNNEESRARFYKEAIAPAKLFHPNIVAIYDLDEEEGTPFIVMEFLDGLDLKYFRTAKIRFTIPQILNILIQTSEALDYAHKHGIVHRDVKPANIILQKNGVIKLLDFGIARLAESTQQTRTGVAMGTPAYMSPEQARGQRVDPRTDQYSVGVIAYELIAGANPFQAENYTGVLYKIINHFPTPVTEAEPMCPPELSAAIMRTIEKERDDRFPDLKVFSKECQRILAGFKSEDSRLELTMRSIDQLETTALQEPYKVRLIRKYIKEFQFEAASRLLDKLRTEKVDQTLLQSLQTELHSQNVKKRVVDLMKVGTDLVDNGDFDLALSNFNEALDLDPDNVEAITWIQKIRRLKKEKLFREQVQPLMAEAGRKSSAGLYMEAMELYRKVLALDPEYVEVRPLLEENERLLVRATQIQRLASELHAALRQLDLSSAASRLEELEKLAPDAGDTRQARTAVWKALQSELSARAARVAQREGLLEMRDWLRAVFGDRAVIGFLSTPAHTEQKNELIQEIRRLVTGWLQAQQLDAAQLLLDVMLPFFPRQAALQSLATEVENLLKSAQESRRRQLAQEQQVTEGIQSIRELLQEDRPEEALRLHQEVTRYAPAEKTLVVLRPEIEEAIRRKESERQLQQQLEQARQMLQSEQLDKAGAILDALETAHPRHPEVRTLRSSLEEKTRLLRQREEIRRLQEEIARLRETGHLEQAIDTARRAAQQFPEEAMFLHRLAELQRFQEELARKGEIRAKAQEIQELTGRQQYLKASKAVFELKNRFPDEPAILDILKSFHEKRYEYVQEVIRSAQSFSANKAFDEARSILERATAECPDSVDLQGAMQELVVAEVVQKGMAEVRAYLAEKKYDLAMATLEGLLARYPEESNIVRLYSEVRQQRTAYIQESLQHARTFARENDFDRAVSLLRTALEIVPNATEVQDEIDALDRQHEAFVRQRREAAEGARLEEAELERATAEAQKFKARGDLFDALRVLEETRRRFPKAGTRLESLIHEIQELLDLQMHIPETALPVRPAAKTSRWLIAAAAAVLLVAVVTVAVVLLKPAPPPVTPQPEPAVLAVDLRPWGEVLEIVRLDDDQKIPLENGLTPMQLSLPPGHYRVTYRLGDQPNGRLTEELNLASKSYQVLRKVSPALQKNLDKTVEGLVQ